MATRRQIALLGLLLLAAAPAGSGASWFVIAAGGGRPIGYSSHELRQGREGPEAVDTYQLWIRELDQPDVRITEETVTRFGAAGRPHWIGLYSQAGLGWSRTEATIGDDRAEIAWRTRSDRRTLTLPLPLGLRFDNGAGLLRGWNRRDPPRLEFQDFSLGDMAVDRVVIEPAPGAVPDGEGRLALLRKRYEGRDLRAIARLLVDRDNRVLEVDQPMLGTSVTIRPAERLAALGALAPYSVLHNAAQRAPYRIPAPALQGHIRYRFGFRDGIVFDFPETGEQRVTAGDEGVTLDICAGCGRGLPSDEASRTWALRPTRWLQSDHPRIRSIVAQFGGERSGARKMERLAARVRQLMPRVDFAGHYSALETLARHAGDCTEAAVLLAALGRAARIPTRVASGLVYSRENYHGVGNVFMPHSWVLAYVDGEWKSFDAALDRFDATHIALTIGDGDPRAIAAANQLAGLILWHGMTEVRTRPGS